MTDHLSPDVLARLARHDWSHLTPEQRRHLVTCARCRDALVEATGTAHEFEARREATPPPPDLEALILARTSGRPRRHAAERRWSAAGRRSVPGRWMWTAAALPAAAALVLALLTSAPTAGPPTAVVAPIQQALAQVPVDGMVFPDLDPASPDLDPARSAAAFRGGATPTSPLQTSVQGLVDTYRDHPEQARTAQWVVGGYLALDDLPSARLFADDALQHHPHDSRLLAAAGIVAFREGRLARSDSLLMAALERADDDPMIRFNVAVLQLEQGRRGQAIAVLRQLAEADGTPLAARAHGLLQQLTPQN